MFEKSTDTKYFSNTTLDYSYFNPIYVSTPINSEFYLEAHSKFKPRNLTKIFEDCQKSEESINSIKKKTFNTKSANKNSQKKMKFFVQLPNKVANFNESLFSESENKNISVIEKVKKIVEKYLNSDPSYDDCILSNTGSNYEKLQPVEIADSHYPSKVKHDENHNQTADCTNKENTEVMDMKYSDFKMEENYVIELNNKSTQTEAKLSDICIFKTANTKNIKNIDLYIKKLKRGILMYGLNFQKISKIQFAKEKIKPVDLFLIFYQHIITD